MDISKIAAAIKEESQAAGAHSPNYSSVCLNLTGWQLEKWRELDGSSDGFITVALSFHKGLISASQKPPQVGEFTYSPDVAARCLGFSSCEDYCSLAANNAGLGPLLFELWRKGSGRKETLTALIAASRSGELTQGQAAVAA